ncbi:condensation domain-containing protein [Streptomyces regalis]|uniref:condensation domain-containing protein n=1 Tax=Streptomyces regalis TaxID=68262 RepID=UPI00131D4A91
MSRGRRRLQPACRCAHDRRPGSQGSGPGRGRPGGAPPSSAHHSEQPAWWNHRRARARSEGVLRFVDLSGGVSPEQSALRAATDEAAEPFALSRAPLLRATLYRLGPEEHLLSLVVHHSAGDGWSLNHSILPDRRG